MVWIWGRFPERLPRLSCRGLCSETLTILCGWLHTEAGDVIGKRAASYTCLERTVSVESRLTLALLCNAMNFCILMVDTLSKSQRSQCMSRVRSEGTKPEQTVENLLKHLGIRYEKHRRDLPGKPDFTLVEQDVAVFVNGCFWHGHRCKRGRLPKTRRQFWQNKISGNIKRDRRKRRELRSLGWRTMTIWQCRSVKSVRRRLERIAANAKTSIHHD